MRAPDDKALYAIHNMHISLKILPIPCPLPSPSTWASFDLALNIARHPASIKVSRLRFHFLTINKAIPGLRIETNVTLYRFKTLVRGFVAPCSILYDLFVPVGRLEVPVCSTTFPLAERGVGGWLQWDCQGRTGNIVCWEKSAVEPCLCYVIKNKYRPLKSYMEDASFQEPNTRLWYPR